MVVKSKSVLDVVLSLRGAKPKFSLVLDERTSSLTFALRLSATRLSYKHRFLTVYRLVS